MPRAYTSLQTELGVSKLRDREDTRDFLCFASKLVRNDTNVDSSDGAETRRAHATESAESYRRIAKSRKDATEPQSR